MSTHLAIDAEHVVVLLEALRVRILMFVPATKDDRAKLREWKRIERVVAAQVRMYKARERLFARDAKLVRAGKMVLPF